MDSSYIFYKYRCILLVLFFIPQTSVVLGVLAALLETEVPVGRPKYVHGNWHMLSPVVSRSVCSALLIPSG